MFHVVEQVSTIIHSHSTFNKNENEKESSIKLTVKFKVANVLVVFCIRSFHFVFADGKKSCEMCLIFHANWSN